MKISDIKIEEGRRQKKEGRRGDCDPGSFSALKIGWHL
jgi:hypothetical protein